MSLPERGRKFYTTMSLSCSDVASVGFAIFDSQAIIYLDSKLSSWHQESPTCRTGVASLPTLER